MNTFVLFDVHGTFIHFEGIAIAGLGRSGGRLRSLVH